MKGKKKLAALLLAASMLTGTVLAGCQSGDSGATSSAGGSSTTPPASSAGEPATGEDGRAMEGNLYLEGLPIVKEKETFSVLIDDNIETSDRLLLNMIAEDTNIDVDWQIYPYEVAVEKRNLALSSGDYTDVIAGWLLGTDDMVRYGSKEGIFIPLEDLISSYAPNIEAVLNTDNIRRDMTLPDGHIYNPPYPIGEPQMIFGPWINKAWLDNLNLQMPTTMEEYKEVLIAFRDQDPNGNGRKDEIPFSSRSDHFFNMMAFFGYPVPDADLIMVDGEPVFPGTMDFYKEAILFYRDLFAEGLIDPEIFTQDMTVYSSKGKAEDAVYGSMVAYWPNDISPGRGEDGLGIRNADYVPLPPLKSSTTDKPMWRRGSTGLTLFRTQFAITDKAKNPATILRWLDYVYSEDISMQTSVGVYGVTGQKNDDGTYELLPKTEETGAPTYVEWIGSLPKLVLPEMDAKIKKDAFAMDNLKDNDELDAVWANNMLEMPPALWLSPEESSQISTIVTDIGNYMKQKRAEWVSGAADVNAEWDGYLKQLDALGLQTLIEVRGGAMKRAMGQ